MKMTMTMETKEEIWKAVMGKDTHCYHFPELEQLAYLAMEEYANQFKVKQISEHDVAEYYKDEPSPEQDAVEFMEWKDKYVPMPYAKDVLLVNDVLTQFYKVDDKLYTMKQLYQLFKQSKTDKYGN